MSKKILLICLIIFSLLPVLTMAANDPLTQAQQIATGINLPTNNTTPQDIAINSIRYFFTFIGFILIVSIMYAGFQWLTSNGEEDKITKAKNRLKYSILGLLIILSGYAIVLFVNKQLNAPSIKVNKTTCEYSPNRSKEENDKQCTHLGRYYYCSEQGNCLFDASEYRP